MLVNVKEFKRPSSVREALKLFSNNANSRYLAGGVILSRTLGKGTDMLIDLTTLPLNSIKVEDKAILIGATLRLNDLYHNPDLDMFNTTKYLKKVLSVVASEQIRNMATFGGAIAARHYWSDILPAFLVMDAEITIENLEGSSRLSLEEYLSSGNAERFKGSIITEIIIPRAVDEFKFHFEKFSRTKVDIATLNLAVLYKLEGKNISDIRISCGGLESVVRRYRKTERNLTSKLLTLNNLKRAFEVFSEEMNPIKDLRGGIDFKKRLIKAMFESVSNLQEI